jgi:alcohol dehydrogenase
MLAPDSLVGNRVALERAPLQRARRSAAVAGRALLGARPGSRRMRSLVALPGGRLRWRQTLAPAVPGPLAAVVRPIAAGTCDLDCALVLGATQIPLPLHLGHECVAEVLSVGSRVASVAPGDRVVVPFQINCGQCAACRAGLTGSCASVPPIAMYGFGFAGGHWGGAYADELAVPFADAMLVPLPEGVDPAAAVSVADNVCDGYRHIAPHLPSLLAREPDAAVLVLGAVRKRSRFTPSVPLYAGMVAKALGARRVVLADAREHVREHARRLGIESVEPSRLRRMDPFPLVADVSVDRIDLALGATGPDGVCSSSGGLHRQARLPMLRMYIRNATLHVGRTHARAVMPEVLDLIATGRLRPQEVTTRVAALDEAPSVLGEHVRDPRSVKTVLLAG